MTESTPRACLSCPNLYRGPIFCPKCGEPGEPLRTRREATGIAGARAFADQVMQTARTLGRSPTTRALEQHGRTRQWFSGALRSWGTLRPEGRERVADCAGLDERTLDRMWVQYAQG